MTEMEKLLRRMALNQRNNLRALRGETLLPIPEELMNAEELAKLRLAKSVRNIVNEEDTDNKNIHITAMEENEKEKLNKVEVNESVEKKEDEVKIETKVNKEKEVEIKSSEEDLKTVVGVLKEKLLINNDEIKEYKENVKNENEIKSENNKEITSKEVNEPEQVDDTKMKEIKSRIVNLTNDIKGYKTRKPMIDNYYNLTSSKKKAAIVKMLKDIISQLSKENSKINMTSIVDFASVIPNIANKNCRRDYHNMIKGVKEFIENLDKTELTKSIINKLDEEFINLVKYNKYIFYLTIKKYLNEMKELTTEDIDNLIPLFDSVYSRINNGEDFNKISKNIESKMVNENEEIESNDLNNEEETIFLTPEEVDVLSSTMNEVLMGV